MSIITLIIDIIRNLFNRAGQFFSAIFKSKSKTSPEVEKPSFEFNKTQEEFLRTVSRNEKTISDAHLTSDEEFSTEAYSGGPRLDSGSFTKGEKNFMKLILMMKLRLLITRNKNKQHHKQKQKG